MWTFHAQKNLIFPIIHTMLPFEVDGADEEIGAVWLRGAKYMKILEGTNNEDCKLACKVRHFSLDLQHQ